MVAPPKSPRFRFRLDSHYKRIRVGTEESLGHRGGAKRSSENNPMNNPQDEGRAGCDGTSGAARSEAGSLILEVGSARPHSYSMRYSGPAHRPSPHAALCLAERIASPDPKGEDRNTKSTLGEKPTHFRE